MIYAYMRVSTNFEGTKDRNQSFDRQLMILKEKYNLEDNQLFQERISGGVSTKDRPEFDRMMNLLKSGDMIVVTEMSRFSRSLQDLIETVNRLTKKKVGVTFLKEGITIDDNGLNPMNKFIFQLFGAFAEFEKSLIADRVKMGMQASKLKGTKLGRPIEMTTETEAQFKRDYLNGMPYATMQEIYGISKPTVIATARRLNLPSRNNKKQN